MKGKMTLLAGAFAACFLLASEASALDGGQAIAVKGNDAQIYFGKAKNSRNPAVVNADRVYKAIPEYQRILSENLTEKDVRYSFLMLRATKKFKQAVAEAAKEESRDLVGNVGTVSWGDNAVPDITDIVMSHLKAIESASALRASGVSVSDIGVVSIDPKAQPTTLDLSALKLSDDGLSSLNGLDGLTNLDLSASPVGDDGVLQMKGLKTLETLSLAGTNITDKTLVRLEGSPALKHLDVTGTQITNAGLQSIAKIPNLRTLRIGLTNVTGEGIAVLSQLRMLEILDLTGLAIHDPGLQQLFMRIEPFMHLHTLVLSSTKIGAGCFPVLARLPALKELKINLTMIPNEAFVQMAEWTRIETLDVSDTPIGDEGFIGALKMTALKVVDVTRTQIHEPALIAFLRERPNVKVIPTVLVPPPPVFAEFGDLYTRSDLNLQGKTLTDQDLRFLANLTNLQSLDLTGTAITDVGMDFVAQIPNLRELRVSGTAVTDTGIWKMAPVMTLKNFYMANCAGVTNASASVLGGMNALEIVDVSHTMFNGEGVNVLQNLKPSLQIINIQ